METETTMTKAAPTFNPTLARQIFAKGEADEMVNANRDGKYLAMYQKFYDAGREKQAKALEPIRAENAKKDRELQLELIKMLGDLAKYLTKQELRDYTRLIVR